MSEYLKLKPCPLCDGTYAHVVEHFEMLGHERLLYAKILCPCGAQSEDCMGLDCVSVAEEKWNHRPAEERLVNLLKQIREHVDCIRKFIDATLSGMEKL